MRSLAAASCLLLALLVAGCGDDETDAESSARLLAGAQEFEQYRLFSVGSSFEGLPLVAAPDADGGPVPGSPSVGFIYGTCKPPADEGGCSPPLTVQIHRACDRPPVEAMGGGYRKLTLRGVPAALVDGDPRLELRTGDVTIVVFARTVARVRRAAAALRSLDGHLGPTDDLPRPVDCRDS
jgi:hypothetical protein